MSALQITYFSCVAINTLVLVPIVCYYTFQLWQLRNQSLLSKRYSPLVILIIFIAIVYASIFRVMGDLPRIIPSISYGSAKSTLCIRLFCYNIFQILVILMSYRIWLLYYDYTKGLHCIQNKWESKIIDDKTDNHWTLKYSKYLSHKSGILRWICVCYLVFALTCIILSGLAGFEWIVQPIFLGLGGVVLIALFFKGRTCRDECFFLAETKILVIELAIYLIIYNIIMFIFYNNSEFKALLTYIITIIGIFICSLILTKWVINQYEKRKFKKLITPNEKRIKFIDILSNKDAFDLFALHLVKEFSLENLLFLYESMQFKMECLNNGFIDEKHFGTKLDFGKKVNQIKRQKSMVNDCESFNYNLHYIVHRYITNASEYCVNVSSATRNKLESLAENVDPDDYHQNNNHDDNIDMNMPGLEKVSSLSVDLEHSENQVTEYQKIFKCLDQAINEIVHLVASDSFVRFSQTEEFGKLYP